MLTALVLALAPLADVPFEGSGGRVWFSGSLNGQRVDALLDSGASGLYAFEAAAARARGTKGDAFSVSGVGDAQATAWHAKDLRFGLPGTSVEAPVPFILAPAKAMPGRQIDVAAGFDFLLRYVVEIDYAGERLRLYHPWTYRPAEGARELRVRFVQRRPMIDAELEIPGLPSKTVSVFIDSGASVGLELSRKMAAREGLDARFGDVGAEETAGGIGGAGRVRRIGKVRLRLGGLELTEDATVSMNAGGASGAGADYDVMLGGAALRRFEVTFDYWRGRIYLRHGDGATNDAGSSSRTEGVTQGEGRHCGTLRRTEN